MFEVLLTSLSISNFIKDGYLSDFDYVSLNPSSEDQKKIDRMSKRATDGDYSIAEMQDVLDRKPSIERLYQTIKDFASGKKGIVYAINIEHAEHIAAMRNEYAISNNNHIILRGLEKVKVSDDNIAEVVFEGEKKTTWVNLYTMQEFDKRPQVERMGFVELLKVGYNYYFYKNKKLAGIPLRDWRCAVNNRMFMFMEQYVILQEEPDKVYYVVEGEYNKGRQWYLKLQDVWEKNPRKMKEIPSACLPRIN